MENVKFNLELEKKEIEVEIKNLASQANGEVWVRSGGTLVLATCVMSNSEIQKDFFPLTVEYEERFYAAGKIKGPRYIKRETRPSDEAICNARLIDRSIRPKFPKDLKREVQVVITVLSWDNENDPDVLGILAASLALSISDIPWFGPLAAVRIGKINNEFILNPVYKEREESDLDIVFSAGFPENLSREDILVNMIEGNCEEAENEVILKALEFGEEYLKKLIFFQKEIIEKVGKEKIVLISPVFDRDFEKEIKEFLKNQLEDAFFEKDKKQRTEKIENVRKKLICFIEEKYVDVKTEANKTEYALKIFEKEAEEIFEKNIIDMPAGEEKRPDGRKVDELRNLYCEVGLLPRTHGSGLFCRGETHALSILTLGAPGDRQILEGMEISGKKHFMHHYNFPSYCSGEIKPMRGPGRREIGHGMLAEKALLPVIPSFDKFPYTIRIVTEILCSNGSTSMASVSASSLALMDAGVPITSPVAGISIGLIMNKKGDYKILTDIQGPEDHYGDMDFKIAGTRKGITAIQMDIKIEGINKEILKQSLFQAKEAREKILDSMEKVIPGPRDCFSPFAPHVLTLRIDPEKIREVVGPGGRVINEIIGETGVDIDIEQSGLIYIVSENNESAQKAASWIENITHEVKVGELFQGKIKRIFNFGAMAEILPGQEGLIHISQLAPYRVERVEEIVKIGDIVPVKVISIDEQGRINLSLKEARKAF